MSRLRTNVITNRMANGAPTVSNGLVISGVTTTSDIRVGTGATLIVYGGANFSGIVTAGIVTATKFSGNTAQGGGNDSVFQMNGMTVTQDFEFPDGQSAMSVGPITINSGVEVTVPDGQNWVIL